MKNLFCFGLLLSCGLLTGCGGSDSHGNYPGPSAVPGTGMRDVIRVGDKITVRLTGVPDDGYFTEMQVPPTGEISVNLLTQSFHAAGLTPAELAAQITDAYKSQRIYTNPVITVLPEERFINVSGDVRGPSRVVYSPDSTVISTIISCGGFTEYADRHHVRIIRGQQSITVDCVKAIATPGNDPAGPSGRPDLRSPHSVLRALWLRLRLSGESQSAYLSQGLCLVFVAMRACWRH